MTYKVTNPHSTALSFGEITVLVGQNFIAGIPADVVKSMRDAGLRVEEEEGSGEPASDDERDVDDVDTEDGDEDPQP